LNHDELRDLADSLMFLPDIVESASADDPLLSDAADQAMLATLIAFHADYLVTGDKNLLALADPYSIFAPAAFWARHRQNAHVEHAKVPPVSLQRDPQRTEEFVVMIEVE
jgi:predicted nucleic acid-binding protein